MSAKKRPLWLNTPKGQRFLNCLGINWANTGDFWTAWDLCIAEAQKGGWLGELYAGLIQAGVELASPFIQWILAELLKPKKRKKQQTN